MTHTETPADRSARTFPVWTCKIGIRGTVPVSPGADLPMRRAVDDAFKAITGEHSEFIFSGWGGSLDECELAVVENRIPGEAHYREKRIRDAAPDMLALLEALVEQARVGYGEKPVARSKRVNVEASLWRGARTLVANVKGEAL